LRPVPFLRDEYFWTPDGLRRHAAKEKVVLRKLEDLVAAETRRLVRLKARGAVGFKTRACRRAAADEAAARLVFNRIMRRGKCAQVAPLDDYLFGKCLEAAGELEVPVAVHAGLWGNFPEIAPALMIPWAQQYPKTHFDLFHLGFPNTLEAVVIGKNFPNVSLNLCWCYLLSPSVTRQMLEAILDLVPLNKVIGFGGDYPAVVQKVYGHRAMATETIAAVLARRVAAGEFSEDRALEIARRWLCANPAAIYRV
jgi:predicted TIM-barrel fold metal-dependent hydrolase